MCIRDSHHQPQPDQPHQCRQDHAGPHAAGPRCRRGARCRPRHRCRIGIRAGAGGRGHADAVGYPRLWRYRAAADPAAAGRQSAGLAAHPGLGPLARAAIVVKPAGGAQCATKGRRDPLPRQRQRGSGGGGLCGARNGSAGLDRQAGDPAAQPDGAAASRCRRGCGALARAPRVRDRSGRRAADGRLRAVLGAGRRAARRGPPAAGARSPRGDGRALGALGSDQPRALCRIDGGAGPT